MFDTSKVANNIKAARTKKNMTQMNLADEMGVSYQAVSNWERGNSMPDISRLQELYEILDISFEELVGEKSRQTEVAERLMSDKEAEVTLEEIVQVAPLVNPNKIDKTVREAINKENEISCSTLIKLAPFMDKDNLDMLAKKVSATDIGKLCGLAPFLRKDTLSNIVKKAIEEENLNTSKIVGLAPFLSKDTIKVIVDYMIQHGQEKSIVSFAPFMGNEVFSTIANSTAIKKDDVERFECSASDKDLDDLDEDEVARLAFAALENGEKVDNYLDYMDEDDIAKLASKAMKTGKNIDIFLDYLDEDMLKELLLQATRR